MVESDTLLGGEHTTQRGYTIRRGVHYTEGIKAYRGEYTMRREVHWKRVQYTEGTTLHIGEYNIQRGLRYIEGSTIYRGGE